MSNLLTEAEEGGHQVKSFQNVQNGQSPNSPEVMERNMRPSEAASYTGLSESTLAKLRMRHKRDDGPRYIKISGCVIYRRSDLDDWMDQHIVGEVNNG